MVPPTGTPPAGARFYVAVRDYEQERAREALVDTNLKLILASGAPENGFGYLNLIDEPSPPHWIERLRQAVPLPPGARAVIVDAGRMARVVVTGSPVGERILEFNFNRHDPSFDAWVRGEWREEIAFRNLSELFRAVPRLVERYFGREALEKPQFLT